MGRRARTERPCHRINENGNGTFVADDPAPHADGNATLEPIVMPMLKTLAAYDRSVHRIAREDEVARHLRPRPASARSWRSVTSSSLRGYEASLILRAAGFERVKVLDGGTATLSFWIVTGRTRRRAVIACAGNCER